MNDMLQLVPFLEIIRKEKDKIMVLDADVVKSTSKIWVKDKYPNKLIDMEITEQYMLGTCARLSLVGIIPFASTYATFLTVRACNQIRTTICLDIYTSIQQYDYIKSGCNFS